MKKIEQINFEFEGVQYDAMVTGSAKKRTQVIGVRFSRQEMQEIKTLANESGIPASTLIRLTFLKSRSADKK